MGSRISGYLSDTTVARWIAKRDGQFVPEDRLRASLISAAVITPISTLAVGFAMQYWTTTAGLAISLLLLFVTGIGVSVCNRARFVFSSHFS